MPYTHKQNEVSGATSSHHGLHTRNQTPPDLQAQAGSFAECGVDTSQSVGIYWTPHGIVSGWRPPPDGPTTLKNPRVLPDAAALVPSLPSMKSSEEIRGNQPRDSFQESHQHLPKSVRKFTDGLSAREVLTRQTISVPSHEFFPVDVMVQYNCACRPDSLPIIVLSSKDVLPLARLFPGEDGFFHPLSGVIYKVLNSCATIQRPDSGHVSHLSRYPAFISLTPCRETSLQRRAFAVRALDPRPRAARAVNLAWSQGTDAQGRQIAAYLGTYTLEASFSEIGRQGRATALQSSRYLTLPEEASPLSFFSLSKPLIQLKLIGSDSPLANTRLPTTTRRYKPVMPLTWPEIQLHVFPEDTQRLRKVHRM
ncbi:hypothetical protein EW146_g392 [Bondarzewia mesenterica]|uniref:Uncharacterized protein n=1 Tax=Bondarzewia mesenterica TaxID=1095465 RepID=A0A4S4M723_9AGAM|nr:hypothetical protein EW146_g392 [Bondarzewia mesenterica]